METKMLWDMIDKLRDEVNIHIDTITDLNGEISKLEKIVKLERKLANEFGLERDNLHKDNKTLLIAKDDKKRKNHELRNKLADATKEIRELKADIKHDAKVCEDYDDGLLAEIDKLKAENERLKEERNKMVGYIVRRDEEYNK